MAYSLETGGYNLLYLPRMLYLTDTVIGKMSA